MTMRKILRENLEDLVSPNLWLALGAEYIGTFAITLLGCGAWLSTVNVVQISLTFGLAVASVVWVFYHVSGAHFNPAVTAATTFTGKVTFVRGILYIAAQLGGGVSGAGLLYGLETGELANNMGANKLGAGVTAAQGFAVELLITFVYTLAVVASDDKKRSDLKGSASLTIGLATVACLMFAAPYTRAGMNPARSFAPALIVGIWKDHWVFWVGPLTGATLAALIYQYIFSSEATFSGIKKCLETISRKESEPDKAPLEEVKDEVIQIDGSKMEDDDDDEVERGQSGK